VSRLSLLLFVAPGKSRNGSQDRFTEEAETQLLEILDYLADESEVSRGSRAAGDLRRCLRTCREARHRPHASDLTERPLKFWSVYSYLVVSNACASAAARTRQARRRRLQALVSADTRMLALC
jgi:hypothetical protein